MSLAKDDSLLNPVGIVMGGEDRHTQIRSMDANRIGDTVRGGARGKGWPDGEVKRGRISRERDKYHRPGACSPPQIIPPKSDRVFFRGREAGISAGSFRICPREVQEIPRSILLEGTQIYGYRRGRKPRLVPVSDALEPQYAIPHASHSATRLVKRRSYIFGTGLTLRSIKEGIGLDATMEYIKAPSRYDYYHSPSRAAVSHT